MVDKNSAATSATDMTRWSGSCDADATVACWSLPSMAARSSGTGLCFAVCHAEEGLSATHQPGAMHARAHLEILHAQFRRDLVTEQAGENGACVRVRGGIVERRGAVVDLRAHWW